MSRPPPPLKSDYAFYSHDKVRFSDVDVVGHGNSLAIGGFFEASRVELLQGLGISQTGEGLKCSLAKLTFEYLAELNMFEAVTVADKVTRLGTSSFTLSSALFVTRGGAEIAIATCDAICVIIDSQSRRPAPLPAAARSKLEQLARG